MNHQQHNSASPAPAPTLPPSAPAAAQTEYDKQFQADLERATALSMETHAMDQYKRNKLQFSHPDHHHHQSTPASRANHASRTATPNQQTMRSYASQVAAAAAVASPTSYAYAPATRRPRPESANALPYASSAAAAAVSPYSLQSSASTGSIAALPPPVAMPSRRISEHQHQRGRSSPPDTSVDLISFSQPAPTDAASATVDEFDHTQHHQNQQQQRSRTSTANDAAYAQFQHMVSELHKMNAQLHQIPPAFRSPATHPAAAVTQMVRYQPPEPIALDSDRLNKLYSMPYQPYAAAAATPATIHIRTPQPPIAFPAQPSHSIYPQLLAAPAPRPNSSFLYSTPPPPAGPGASAIHVLSTKTPPPAAPAAVPQKHVIGWDVNADQRQQQPSLVPMPAGRNTPTGSSDQYSSVAITRRRPSRPSQTRSNATNDLIDLEHAGDEDNTRVSVLEAFDPLLMSAPSPDADTDRGDAASDGASTSYYSEYDPFDYLYNSGTQYSDPVYDAVNRIDAHSSSASASVHGGGGGGGASSVIGWNIGDDMASVYGDSVSLGDDDDEAAVLHTEPPPLPPRRTAPTTTTTTSLPQPQQQLAHQTQHGGSHSFAAAAGTTRKLYTNVRVCKTYEPELLAFYEMVRRVRAEYKYTDRRTNVGHVVAAEFNNRYAAGTSIKLLVHPALDCFDGDGGVGESVVERGQVEGYGAPVAFTCDISTTVEHVIMHVFCELEGQIRGTVADYNLKPIGLTEWLSTASKLSQLECVHNSFKLDQDVQLGLCARTAATMDVIARTQQDDIRDADLKPEDIVAHEPVVETLNFDSLMILLETLEDEIAKLESTVADAARHTVISCTGIVQAVKMVCALLGALDTLDIAAAISDLQQQCRDGQTVISRRDQPTSDAAHQPDIVSEAGDYAEVQLRPRTVVEAIRRCCDRLRDAVRTLLETYSHAFRVDFHVLAPAYGVQELPISALSQPVLVRLMCVHRPPVAWTPTYEEYLIGVQIYHGTRYISEPEVAQCSARTAGGLFPRLTIDSCLRFEHNPVCTLPRESRLIFVLYGCTSEPLENGEQHQQHDSGVTAAATQSGAVGGSAVVASGGGGVGADASGAQRHRITKVELGWTAIQFFEFERRMISGSYLLALWPPTTDKFLGPAPAKGTHPRGYHCPVLSIEMPHYGTAGRHTVVFPADSATTPQAAVPRLDFSSLDRNLQQELIDTAELGYYPSALDKREVLWEKRHYLHSALPHALPKVLHAAHSWDFASLVDLHALVRAWQPLPPLQALELLLPRYPDATVRAHAVQWMAALRSDQLVAFLPQLLQALKHDTYEASPMAEFLLRRALESPRVAHHLYWQLVHSLPGESPHNSAVLTPASAQSAAAENGAGGGSASAAAAAAAASANDAYITQARYTRRNQMMLRALLASCGERLAGRLLAQDLMCKALADCAHAVQQQSKDGHRAKALLHGLDDVQQVLSGRPLALPLAPGAEVRGVNARTSGYFNSNTLPLRVNFAGPDGRTVAAIFKAGDDLQQDQLTIQLVRIMDRLWLEEGLDLKMVTFNCVPTGRKKGMIEMVGEAETLRKIQVEWGLTGSFKDKPIAEWLARQNPSPLEYQRAVDNFTVSCAGYSVATYILGICDRHNDNIMLKTSGHLFHIDFGKFLGDAQMFGNFKRDRTPFVLTSDMAYVINGGDRPSTQFHHFVDLCCQAFNIVRKHGDLILHMVALMATSGIPGVTADAVNYVRKALLPGQSNPEAAAAFAKMIHISLKSWFTQFNFFLHNLAQLRFTGDEGSGELLSFVPRTYTMSQDGRLKSVTVHGFQKRYDLEKYYTFILKVTRQSQPDPAYLFRSYKEFSEFHQKLCMHYPLAKLHSLPSGIHVGRSNIKTVAERRLPEIRHFLVSLFNSADEIAHSDVVYTFFHPLLRDQQEQNIHVAKVKENNKPATPKERVCGEIKLSLQYHRGALTVMIHHARSLPATTGGQEPNTYVKTYLKPDPTKVTKRKTKVVRKNCFPSYMETLEYRMPIESIQHRVLQVTVWSHDSLQENEFLGGVELPFAQLDLTREMMSWFPLRYLSRS